MSVARFNHIIREADARAEKINSMIGTAVCFLMDKLDQNPEWRGSSESVPLNFEDATVWNWCMKDDYQPVDEKTKVWFSRGSLTVYYGEQKNQAPVVHRMEDR